MGFVPPGRIAQTSSKMKTKATKTAAARPVSLAPSAAAVLKMQTASKESVSVAPVRRHRLIVMMGFGREMRPISIVVVAARGALMALTVRYRKIVKTVSANSMYASGPSISAV